MIIRVTQLLNLIRTFRVRDVTARVEDRFNFAFIFSFKPAISTLQMLKFLDMLHALKFHRYLLWFFNKTFTCKRFISHSEQ